MDGGQQTPWGCQLASTVPSEAGPIESLLVFLVMMESPGTGGERWVMLLVLPEMMPHIPNNFSLYLDAQMDVPKTTQLVNFNASLFYCDVRSLLSVFASLRSSLPGVPSDILPSLSILREDQRYLLD